MLCAIIGVPVRMVEILSGTITGWSVNAGLGPPVSYPTIVPYCTLMRPFVSVRGDVWVEVMMGSF
jgi:hypothetical protein